jgi:hypothetical protein
MAVKLVVGEVFSVVFQMPRWVLERRNSELMDSEYNSFISVFSLTSKILLIAIIFKEATPFI